MFLPSADINSYLNFQDYLGILALNGAPAPGLSYQLAYSAHYISQSYHRTRLANSCIKGCRQTRFTAISITLWKATSRIILAAQPKLGFLLW